MRGLLRFTRKPSIYLVEPQNQDWASAGVEEIRARREASIPADAWRDRKACVGRTRSATTGWPCDEEECYLPLRGCITT
jgi:hypothetical protein